MSFVLFPATYDGTALEQVSDGLVRMAVGLVRGLDDSPEVRGTDTVIPGAAGRIARSRVRDRRVIELAGFIGGVGASEAAQRADLRALLEDLRELFDPTRSPGTLSVELEDGSAATISARPINMLCPASVASVRAEVSIELEAIGADWSHIPVGVTPPAEENEPPEDESVTFTDYSVPVGITTISGLQTFINGVSNGTNPTNHSRVLLGAGRTYTGTTGLNLTGRSYLTIDGQGTEDTYGQTGGATIFINGTRNPSSLKFQSCGIWMRSGSAAVSATNVRICRLRILGNSTNYATVNAGDGGESQHGIYDGGTNDLEIRHVTIEKNGGDGVYFTSSQAANTGANPSTRAWMHGCLVQENGRMGVALIWTRDNTVEGNEFRDICYSPWDVEPNQSYEGIFGTTRFQDNLITGRWSWDTTFDDAVFVCPNRNSIISGTIYVTDNVIDADAPPSPASASIGKFGRSETTPAVTATIYFERNSHINGGRPAPAVDFARWSGPVYVRDNVGLVSSGTPYVNDMGNNTGGITESDNT